MPPVEGPRCIGSFVKIFRETFLANAKFFRFGSQCAGTGGVLGQSPSTGEAQDLWVPRRPILLIYDSMGKTRELPYQIDSEADCKEVRRLTKNFYVSTYFFGYLCKRLPER